MNTIFFHKYEDCMLLKIIFMDRVILKLQYFFGDLLLAHTHLIGVELLLALDAPSRGCFDFQRRLHDQGIKEYFGLGLHLTVVPCQLLPTGNRQRSTNIPLR